MGSWKVFECCAIAEATQGWASCNRAARVAARNSADSRLTFQPTEPGTKMPCSGQDEDSPKLVSSASRSSADTRRGAILFMVSLTSLRGSLYVERQRLNGSSLIQWKPLLVRRNAAVGTLCKLICTF